MSSANIWYCVVYYKNSVENITNFVEFGLSFEKRSYAHTGLITDCSFLIDCAMCTFIEDYLQNPSQAIQNARSLAASRLSDLNIDDETIYSQMSSPEFHLYEEIAIC